MTSKTSFFNRGIYKATLRRYLWGAVLYGILLFMCTSMVILFNVDPSVKHLPVSDRGPLIFGGSYTVLPVIISIGASAVMALLAFRFIHSKKTAVFVHSLPVTRNAHFFSTLAASFTLMAAPVVLNGLILMLLSATAYGAYFDITSCLVWIGVNLLSVFLMFSVSTLSAFLTGNTFAAVAINILLHLIGPILAGGISALAEVFLHGYIETNSLMELAAVEWNFVGYISEIASDLGYRIIPTFDIIKCIVMCAIALALYAASLLLYRGRRMERAEDVAAYRCMNGIYKYLAAFLSAIAVFALFSHTAEEGMTFVISMMLIVSVVVYFGVEMLLKKSLRVAGAYKGFLAFLAAFSALMCFVAFTGVFGFEGYVPREDEVEGAVLHETRKIYGDDSMAVSDPDVISYILGVHERMVQKANVQTVARPTKDKNELMYISYALKNGKEVHRRYRVSSGELCEALDVLYASAEYKTRMSELFSDDIQRIYSAMLDHEPITTDPQEVEELLGCVKDDYLDLLYTQTYSHDAWNARVGMEYTRDAEDEKENTILTVHERINAHHTRTVGWLLAHGHGERLISTQDDLTVLTRAQWKDYLGTEEQVADVRIATAAGVSVRELKGFEDIEGARRISDAAEKDALREFILTTPVRFEPGREYSHIVCRIHPDGSIESIASFYDGSGVEKFIK